MCYSCLVDVADSDSDSDSDFDDVSTTCTSCDIEMDSTDSVTATVDNAVQTNSCFMYWLTLLCYAVYVHLRVSCWSRTHLYHLLQTCSCMVQQP